MIDLVKSWLHRCLHDHHQCNAPGVPRAVPRSGSEKLPTRLIDIGEEPGLLRPRIVLPSASATLKDIQYLALSHAWSVTVNKSTLKLSVHNLEALQIDIPFEKLPQTFKDALAVTQQLGYRYIWIDSLCIIQDSTEDWEKESTTMNDVYGNCILNIAALGMDGLDACVRRRNPLLVTPCYLAEAEGGIYAYPTARDSRHGRSRLMENLTREGARLPSRGWFVQERLLSHRTLYLGATELYWECATETRCESVPKFNGDRAVYDHSWLYGEKVRFHTLCRLHSLNDDVTTVTQHPWDRKAGNNKTDLLYHWVEIQRTYSTSYLTYKEDRLIAFSGIIQAIQKGTGWTPVAGTWKELWPLDLLWFFDQEPVRRPCSGLKTPSWSWLTIEGPKDFPAVRVTSWTNYHLAQVIDSTTATLPRGTMNTRHHNIGEVDEKTENTITLMGCVRRATWLDGRMKERGSSHLEELQDSNPETCPCSLWFHWDSPPANGHAFLLLLIMTYKNRNLPDSGGAQYYGLILTLSAHCVGGTSGGTTTGGPHHYKRVGMFRELHYRRPTRDEQRYATKFDEGAQEEIVTIC